MAVKFLRLPIQHFSADTGAAGGGDAGAAGAAAGDTGTAGAGDNDAAAGAADKGATGDDKTGGGDTGTGSKLSAEDLKRYQESEFLQALGYTSIEDVKTALAASKQKDDTKQADDKTNASDDKTGDKKDEKTDNAKADDKTADQAGDKTGDKADEKTDDKKADDKTGDAADKSDKKDEPTAEQLATENAGLKAQLAAAKHNVPEESFEDVIAIAERLQKKEDGLTIDAAVKKVIEKYPSFVGAAAPQSDKPRFGTTGSQRQADDRDPFVRELLRQQ